MSWIYFSDLCFTKKTLQRHLAAKYVPCSFNSFNKCSLSLCVACSQTHHLCSFLLRLIVLYIHTFSEKKLKFYQGTELSRLQLSCLFCFPWVYGHTCPHKFIVWEHICCSVFCRHGQTCNVDREQQSRQFPPGRASYSAWVQLRQVRQQWLKNNAQINDNYLLVKLLCCHVINQQPL